MENRASVRPSVPARALPQRLRALLALVVLGSTTGVAPAASQEVLTPGLFAPSEWFGLPPAGAAAPLPTHRPAEGVVTPGPRRVITWPSQERVPLNALDDFGEPITRSEIESRMRGGGAGGLIGGVLGAALLGFAGAAFAFEQCGLFENCSPRQDAFAGLAFIGGIGWGAVLGGVVGSQARAIDRWEALARIRAERRDARLVR